MSDLVVLAFKTEDGALQMRDKLMALQKQQLIALEDAAVVIRRQDGKVKVNGEVAKASKLVKVGDELTIKMRGGKYRTLEILAISHKSVSAKDALLLYKEEKLELSHESQELFDLQWQVAKTIKPKYKGRPTKKERRKIDQFKQKSDF